MKLSAPGVGSNGVGDADDGLTSVLVTMHPIREVRRFQEHGLREASDEFAQDAFVEQRRCRRDGWELVGVFDQRSSPLVQVVGSGVDEQSATGRGHVLCVTKI